MELNVWDKPWVEIVGGERVRKMTPKRRHAILQGVFFSALHAWARGRGQVGTEWDFQLTPRDRFVPDVAFVSNERLSVLTGPDLDVPPFAPDIAVEVRSVGERADVRQRKIGAYLKYGSQLVLDIDFESRTILACDARGVQTFEAGRQFSHPAAPGLVLDLGTFFSEVDPPREG